MSQGDEIFKTLTDNLESIKNLLPQQYHHQQQQHNHYNQHLLQDMQNQQQSYSRNINMQEYQNYADDSPEPEMIDYANMNEHQDQQQHFYQSRAPYNNQQQNGGFNQSQKPYFKKNYDNQYGGRPFNNGAGHNQYGQNPNSGYQGQRKPYFNKFSGQQQTGAPGQAQIYGSTQVPGAKYQGQKPQGGFNNPQSNQFNQGSSTHFQNQQLQNQQETFHQGEKFAGNHIAGTKIFVNNIESNVNEKEILHYFEPYGQINDLKVFHKNDQSYSYVIFDKYEDAYKATNDPSPRPNWSVTLAKSKNTVMQFQQSTLFNPNQQSGNPNPPYHNPNKFNNNENSNPPHFQKPFNKFSQNSNQNQQPPSRYEKPSGHFQNKFDSGNGEYSKPQYQHYNNNLNKANDSNQMLDQFMNQTDVKTQINQTILVREIWISNIDEKCKPFIREIIEDNFGGIEDVEFFDRGKDSFSFVKFFKVQTAYLAFANKDKIAELLETEQVKLTYSDPSRRRNIIGDHENYMEDENLSPVLYISFPYGFKVNKKVIFKIASDYGTVLNVTVKRSNDPKQTSSVLVEFQDIKDTKFAYKHMREDQEKMHPKCEFAILLNSEKFVKENNLKLKEKVKSDQPLQAPPAVFNNSQKPFEKKGFSNKPNLNSSLQEIAGIPSSKPLQSKGRQFSPEKDTEINSKRSYNQFKQNALNSSQEQGFNPDSLDDFQVDEDDDENFIWSGFISISKKGRCGMDAKVIQCSGQLELDNHNLIMTTKCTIQEPLRYPPFSILIFKPSNETYIKPFKDVKAFLNSTPNQAGLIETKNLLIYLLPNCEQAYKFYPQLKEGNILAICHNSDSIKGNLSKKETKYDEKIYNRKKVVQQNDSLDEDDLVYDPTSILQDTSRSNNKYNYKYQQKDNYKDEDIYDPNQVNYSKHDSKNTDLSDLIDDPILVDHMLKSIN